MTLTDAQIVDILKNKPNSAMLDEARKYSKKLRAHIIGEGVDHLIEKISGLENETQLEIRKKYTQTNKAIFARIHRPEDKVFSAKGGSAYYNLPESQKRVFIAQLQDVYNGFSVTKWVESFALQYFHIDPMGLVFMEVGDNTTYPTYKSTSTIIDYKLKGREVEYVVFATEDPTKYRIVDDSFDQIVKWEGDTLTKTYDIYQNYFGRVQAKVISDIIKPNSEYYTSPDFQIIEIADEYLRECSVKSVFKLKHGFPKSWQYASICQTCKGTGHSKGEDCTTCNGSGRAIIKDSSEVITLPIPEENQPTIAPNIAGYISPDVQGWEKMTEELQLLEETMKETYWGVKPSLKTNGVNPTKTATEIVSDAQPTEARLNNFSKWGEDIEKFITDSIGYFTYQNTYKGASVSYGTRYGLESPDTIWNKYQDARKSGAPDSVLDLLLIEYYESKFNTNKVELSKQIKLMKVEPFLHLTFEQSKNVVQNQIDYFRKIYFSEWYNTLAENEVLVKSVADLNKSLTEYAQAKPKIEIQTIK